MVYRPLPNGSQDERNFVLFRGVSRIIVAQKFPELRPLIRKNQQSTVDVNPVLILANLYCRTQQKSETYKSQYLPSMNTVLLLNLHLNVFTAGLCRTYTKELCDGAPAVQ